MVQDYIKAPSAQERKTEKESRLQFSKYASINFMFYITMALGSYVTVFLQSIGFDAQQVGIITALNSGTGVISSPFWGMLSDKIRSVKKIILITLVIGTILFALIPASSGISLGGLSLAFVFIPATMFFKMPPMSLLENWMLKNSSAEGLNYGAIRAFGALSYAIASLVLGYLIPMTGTAFVFYANAVLTFPALLLFLFTKSSADDVGDKKHLTFKEMKIGQVFKDYYLMTYIIFSIFERIPFQCAMTFLPFLVADVGGDTAKMGIILGLRAFIEIPVMLLLKPLRKRIPLYYLIMAASGFFLIESILLSFINSFEAIVAISVLHGIGNGLMLTTGVSYVFQLAPDHLKATCQTILASMNSIAGILGGILGGVLIKAVGVKLFYLIIGLMMLVALVLFILSFPFGEKVLGKKRPGLSIQ